MSGPAGATSDPGERDRPVRFGEVFAVREFRFFWLASAQSALGDQLAKVALSVLVFDRTGSPFLAAATYAVTYLPYVAAGICLSTVADVARRREVMVSADVARAVVMFVPGLPIWVYLLLVALAGMLRQPYDAARLALLPDILTGDRYVGGSAINQVTNQVTQVLGFAVGGAVVAVIGPHESLLVNAGTFAVSALLLRLGLRDRPAKTGDRQQSRTAKAIVDGYRAVFGDSRLVVLIAYLGLTAFYIVPETLVVPYTRAELGLSSFYAGLLLSAEPLGISLGAALVSRLVPPSRRPSPAITWRPTRASSRSCPTTCVAGHLASARPC